MCSALAFQCLLAGVSKMKNKNTMKLKLEGKRINHPLFGDCFQCGCEVIYVGRALNIGYGVHNVIVQEIFDEGVVISQWVGE